MWHLAQLKQKDKTGKMQLQLLAQQKAEHAWTVLTEDAQELVVDSCLESEDGHQEGSLLLIELSPSRQVQKIQDATPWLLEMIEQFLGTGTTPAVLQEEVQRAEQWRQSLTLKSQELQRRALEMEARREQIQELEENLKHEKEQLELLAAQYKANINGTDNEPL